MCDELNYRMLFCFLFFVEINYPDPTNLRKKRFTIPWDRIYRENAEETGKSWQPEEGVG